MRYPYLHLIRRKFRLIKKINYQLMSASMAVHNRLIVQSKERVIKSKSFLYISEYHSVGITL